MKRAREEVGPSAPTPKQWVDAFIDLADDAFDRAIQLVPPEARELLRTLREETIERRKMEEEIKKKQEASDRLRANIAQLQRQQVHDVAVILGIEEAAAFGKKVAHNAIAQHFADPENVFAAAQTERVRMNTTGLVDWVTALRLRGPDFAAFGMALLKSIHYVPWQTFIAVLSATARETVAALGDRTMTASVTILYLPCTNEREWSSNRWFAGAVWSDIGPHVDYVVRSWRHLAFLSDIATTLDVQLNVIFVGDVIMRATGVTEALFHRTFPVDDGPNHETEQTPGSEEFKLAQRIEQGEVANPRLFCRFHFIVPYMSDLVVRQIREIATHVFIPRTTRILPIRDGVAEAGATAVLQLHAAGLVDHTVMCLEGIAEAAYTTIIMEHRFSSQPLHFRLYVYGWSHLFNLPRLTNVRPAHVDQYEPFYNKLPAWTNPTAS